VAALKSVFASAIAGILVAAVTVFAVIALVAASVRISQIADPAWRTAAISIELVAGVFWLLGTVYVATHLAVLIFAKPQEAGDPNSQDSPRPVR
jgi:hypothetical protein